MKALIAASCMFALVGAARADDGNAECPAPFQGAAVSAAKAPAGVTLEFRNGERSAVTEMREQLRAVAGMIEQRGTERMTVSETDAVEFPPVAIDVKDTLMGARVTVRATRLSDISAIRDLAFGFAEYWKTSPCNEPLVTMHDKH